MIRDLQYFFQRTFSRLPNAPIYYDNNKFYSPAWGYLIYSKKVEDDFLEIKGKNYKLKDLLEIDIDVPCLVFGIFLTIYDIHYVVVPITSILIEQKFSKIYSYNKSLIPVENSLISNKTYNVDDLDYIFTNEKCIYRFRSKFGDYFIVAIADRDVNQILNYNKPICPVYQGDYLAFITMGSQVDVIIPLQSSKKLNLISNWKPKNIIKSIEHINGLETILFENE